MKQAPKLQSKPSKAKIAMWFLLGPIVIVIALILFIIAVWNIGTINDKHKLSGAVKELRLPANYQLIETDFSDSHCLDVCAYMTFHYKSVDGKPLDRDLVNKALDEHGWVKDDHYSDEYGGTLRSREGLRTYQHPSPAEYLTFTIDMGS